MNADLQTMWQAWRTAHLAKDDTDSTLLRVMVHETEEIGGVRVPVVFSNSEGTGYGMLISVYMANTTNTGKEDFDAIYAFYKKYLLPTYGLMSWKVYKDGTNPNQAVAPDGDLDAAYALLVADKKWGSAGATNYRQDAINIINNLQKWIVRNRDTDDSQLIARGFTSLRTKEADTNYTMSSYQMVGYYNQFKLATGDAKWDATLKAGYKFYNYFYNLNPTTGLTPFTFLSKPGPNQYQKNTGTQHRGRNFGFDACRTPWRVGVDYLWHGNANSELTNASDSAVNATLAKDMPHRNTQWLKTVSGTNPMNVYSSYELDGTVSVKALHADSPDAYIGSQRNMVSPMAVAAMVDASNQTWLNTMYTWMRQQTPGQTFSDGGINADHGYYLDTVMMVNMLIVTGNMPNLPELP